MRILASSTTFAAVMLVANVAIAQPDSAIALSPAIISQSPSPSVNLNLISPSLKSYQSNDSLLDHLGCSCAVCAQPVKSTSDNI
ncbi:MAG: hypothetical protein ACFCAD_18585 [Pleurocapsa sp.]